MFKIPDIFSPFQRLRKDPLDDRVDRLSSTWSVYILIFSFALASTQLFIGNQLECVAPPQSPSSWIKYYNEYCFISPLLHIPDNYTVEDGSEPTMYFYPWIPYVLFLQAIVFFLPKFLWDGTSSRFGIDLKSILKEAKAIRAMKGERRERRAHELTTYILAYLEFVYDNRQMRFTSPTAFFYIFKKWLYFFGSATQFCLLALFIGSGKYDWGLFSLQNIINQENYDYSLLFPRITFCNVPYREDNQDKYLSFSCVMGMNVVFEKLFTFLYFWILFVMIASLCSAIHATAIFLLPAFRYLAVDSYLKKSGVNLSRKNLLKFLHTNLHADGMLIIILIQDAYGQALAEEICRNLWLNADMQDDEAPVLTKANQYEAFDPNLKHFPQPEMPFLEKDTPKNKKEKKRYFC